MKVLLVDGSNMAMRAAHGGSMPPHEASGIATGLIGRAIKRSGATHMIIAVDCPRSKSWRRERYPDYKATRTTDTAPWIQAATNKWRDNRWNVQSAEGFEADDVIATLAHRLAGRAAIVVVSSDSDLLPLTEIVGCQVLKPIAGGDYQWIESEDACVKYEVTKPSLLRDLKALAGESGDNVPGVPGIGPRRASDLLADHGNLEGILANARCKNGDKVREHEATVRLAYELVGLRSDAPVSPIKPRECGLS